MEAKLVPAGKSTGGWQEAEMTMQSLDEQGTSKVISIALIKYF